MRIFSSGLRVRSTGISRQCPLPIMKKPTRDGCRTFDTLSVFSETFLAFCMQRWLVSAIFEGWRHKCITAWCHWRTTNVEAFRQKQRLSLPHLYVPLAGCCNYLSNRRVESRLYGTGG